MDLTLLYFPSAVTLGALHALEPGHAKTLTAAYLIGTKGTKRDAAILGLSVAATHSLIVVLLAVAAVLIGREAFADEASFYLSLASSGVVVLLGSWLLWRRLRALRRAALLSAQHHDGRPAHDHQHEHPHGHHHSHDHAHLSDEAHARAHAAQLPAYVQAGVRPSVWQIITFGAAGGLVPCPAAVSVMLLSLSVNESVKGFLLVIGFGLGLAATLVGVGLAVVIGLSQLSSTGRFSRLTVYAPAASASLVILSGLIAGIVSLAGVL